MARGLWHCAGGVAPPVKRYLLGFFIKEEAPKAQKSRHAPCKRHHKSDQWAHFWDLHPGHQKCSHRPCLWLVFVSVANEMVTNLWSQSEKKKKTEKKTYLVHPLWWWSLDDGKRISMNLLWRQMFQIHVNYWCWFFSIIKNDWFLMLVGLRFIVQLLWRIDTQTTKKIPKAISIIEIEKQTENSCGFSILHLVG